MIEVTTLKQQLVDNKQRLLEELAEEKQAIFDFLHRQSMQGLLTNNHIFQFVYHHFYNLNNPSLTPQFHAAYFDLMEQIRSKDIQPNITTITYNLYQIKNRNGNPSMQFPLVIDMVHTLNPYFPSFTQNVIQAFQFPSAYHLSGFTKKMERYIDQYRYIHTTYQQLLEDAELKKMIGSVKGVMKNYPDTKKLDLLVNQLGAL